MQQLYREKLCNVCAMDQEPYASPPTDTRAFDPELV
jgi:hypothetical protein